MDNERIETMAQAFEAVGVSIKRDGEYRSADNVMSELWDKWHSGDFIMGFSNI